MPTSCQESAENLLKDRQIYEKDGVFSPATIEGVAKKLKSYNDKELSEKLHDKKDEIKKLIDKYFYI